MHAMAEAKISNLSSFSWSIAEILRGDFKQSEYGKVILGYEINFNRYFYQYVPPRPLEEIDAEMRTLEAEIANLLKEIAG